MSDAQRVSQEPLPTTLLTPVTGEFKDVDLGDKRLERRLLRIAEAADRAPGASLPEQAGSSAALEATYRFLGNENVDARTVFEGHVKATVERASARAQVYVVHDTTEFRFGGNKPREGLGWISTNHRDGFLAHFSICVSDVGEPLGSLGLFAWARIGKRKGRRSHAASFSDPDRESMRWQEAALLTGELLDRRTKAVHVMDREADSIELISFLLEHDQKFVIRVGHDRRLEPGRGAPKGPKLYESLSNSPLFLKREVQLAARGKPSVSKKETGFPARRSRMASLEVRSATREFFAAHNAPAHVPLSLNLNFVEVREADPPEDEPPVLWRLVTTEPIDTADDVAAVVDAYRRRWIIEEFFKALKTGCRFQQLQLESSSALLVALAIESAVAWRMLVMRWMAHREPDASGICVMPRDQLRLLIAVADDGKSTLSPEELTVGDAMLALAGLGGHIRNNGPPGWLILRRGLDKLLTIHRGWVLGQASR